MHYPKQTHWTVAKQMLQFFKHTITYGHHLHHSPIITLHAFFDVDWARDINDNTSISAYVVFVCANPVSQSSKKQHTVARSLTEA